MKKLKLFFALFAMLALGVGNAWAESEIVTFTNKDWAPWTKITSGSSFESASPSRGVANNGVNGSCKSSKSYSNITKISYVASSNTTGGKVTIKVGETTVGETSIPKANNQTFEYVVDNLSGVITLSVTKPSSKTVYVKSITIETSTATPDPTPVTVSLNKTELNLQAGATETLTATITGSTSPVTWSSSATGVASVDNTGKVTAVAAGEATITAAIGDVKATCAVTVTAATTPEEPGTGGESGSYTWDLSKKTYTTGTNEVTWTCSIATMHNTGTNATNYLGGDANSRTSSRFYTGNTLTITPAANISISSVEFTATSENYASVLKNSTWTNASVSVSSSTVTITPSKGASAISATIGGTCGFKGVTVYYTQTGGGTEETVS